MSPEAVIKKNAMFLMELNACMEGDSKDTSTATSGWTINLFPQASVVTPTMTSACIQTDAGVASQPVSNFVIVTKIAADICFGIFLHLTLYHSFLVGF